MEPTEDYCPDSPDNKHRADPKSLHVESDGGDYYIDVNCYYCGRGGCVAGPKNINELCEQAQW